MDGDCFSTMKLTLQKTNFFQSKMLPPGTSLIGTSALVQFFDIKAPVRRPSSVSSQRISGGKRQTEEWQIFDSKYSVDATVEAHLIFALKHEDFDLTVFKHVLLALPEKDVLSYIMDAPTGPLARRIWILYEIHTGKTLKIPDAGKIKAVDLLDPAKYICTPGWISPRHKVNYNLLGVAEFCPFVRKTELITSYIEKGLSERAQSLLNRVSPSLVARASSFLLLADTKASFAIENERLPVNNRERWLKAIQQVGKNFLNQDELIRLHEILIGDFRFIEHGFRTDHVFLGERSIDNEPLPEFIGAKPEDLESLLEGLVSTNLRMSKAGVDPVIQAAAISFGFVYIHPFEDGNGRLQRCLIHHILSSRKFNPQGLVFPVSSVMLKWIDEYRDVLRAHSAPLMDFIEWEPAGKGNLRVTNETADLYRYFDCTQVVEFLYKCVEQTINHDVPDELRYLRLHDETMRKLMDTVSLSNRMAEDFIMFMRQNEWRLPKRRREAEFKLLTEEEVERLELIVRETFEEERV